MTPYDQLAQSVAYFPDEHFAAGKFAGNFWADPTDPSCLGGWVRSNGSLHEHHLATETGSQLLSIDEGLWLNEVTVSGDFASKEEATSMTGRSSEGHPFGGICEFLDSLVTAAPVVEEVYENIAIELWMATFGGVFDFACHVHSAQVRSRSEARDVRIAQMRKAQGPLDAIKASVSKNKEMIVRGHPYLIGVRKLSVIQHYGAYGTSTCLRDSVSSTVD
ncbi:hypothetical protein [Rhizobium sp. BK176]|uniref:hypothetical protein n=1 Tax=Rhizobium sp. BK176 TaxID=2587071 RepID=UPI002168A053|nr:hypothetical protein [Rhizobium sp. BK176]MCS4088796.1 hypothetical protein [Rhizobium sp. BK176]